MVTRCAARPSPPASANVVARDDAAHRVADEVDLRCAGRGADFVDEPAELARAGRDAAERQYSKP